MTMGFFDEKRHLLPQREEISLFIARMTQNKVETQSKEESNERTKDEE